MSKEDAIRRLLAPRSIAVVGATPDPMTISGRLLDSLRRFGFAGDVYPVSRDHQEIAGYRCFAHLDDLPEDAQLDAAFLAVPAEQVIETAATCLARKVRALTVVAGGFAESGDAGREMQAALRTFAEVSGAAVCGPNCIGAGSFVDGYPGFAGTALAGFDALPEGSVALICQSGGLANALVAMASGQGTAFTHVVSSGNEAVTAAHEYLEVIGRDERTRCVLAYLEQLREPETFLETARRVVAGGTPVVVLKAGVTAEGRRAAASHTAALAGSAQVVAAGLRQAGVVQVEDVDDLLDAAQILELVGARPLHRVGVFSQIGGGAAMAADCLAHFGLALPLLTDATVGELSQIVSRLARIANPLDPIAGFARSRERFRAGLAAFARDPNLDVILFISVAGMRSYADALAEDLAAVADEVGKPFVSVFMTAADIVDAVRPPLRSSGVPVYPSISRAVRAMARHRDAHGVLASLRPAGDAQPLAGRRDARQALVQHGVSFPRSVVTDDAAHAVEFARAAGPVALKVAVEGLVHKSDIGGVRLGVTGDEAVRAAVNELLAIGLEAAPHGGKVQVEAQAMARPGVEVIVGVRRDVEMGWYVCVGEGGVLAEFRQDIACRVLPVHERDVQAMVEELHLAQLLVGFRNHPPADVDALVRTVLAVASIAPGIDGLAELELNPVIVHEAGEGCTVVDFVALSKEDGTAMDEALPRYEMQV